MAERGRPKKYTDEVINEYAQKLNVYTEENDIPIIAEFAYQNDIDRGRLYEFEKENEIFSDAIKKCRAKKEAQLEKLGLLGVVSHTMAIFSLKQMGWTDKQQVDMNAQVVQIIDDIPEDEE